MENGVEVAVKSGGICSTSKPSDTGPGETTAPLRRAAREKSDSKLGDLFISNCFIAYLDLVLPCLSFLSAMGRAFRNMLTEGTWFP